MKFSDFLKEAKSSIPADNPYTPVEYWDYIFSGIFLDFEKYRNIIKRKKLKGVECLYSLSPPVYDEFMKEFSDYLKMLSFNGNALSAEDVYLTSYDTLGPPPFKIDVVDKFYTLDKCSKLTSLSVLPAKCPNVIMKDCSGIKSFSGIDKHLTECTNLQLYNVNTTSAFLGLLRIKNLSSLQLSWTDEVINAQPIDGILDDAFQILKKHIPNAKGNAGILECQNELIDLGLDEMAQL